MSLIFEVKELEASIRELKDIGDDDLSCDIPELKSLARLYIRYTVEANKMEDLWFRVIPPQFRDAIRKLLDSTIFRVLEIRTELLAMSSSKTSLIPLYDIIQSLQVSPFKSILRVPRYFTGLTSEIDRIEVRYQKVQHWQKEFNVTSALDSLVSSQLPRLHLFSTDRKTRESPRLGKLKDNPIVDSDAALIISKHWRRYSARKNYRRLLDEEYQYLGMLPEGQDDQLPFPSPMRETLSEHLRQRQADAQSQLETCKSDALKIIRLREEQSAPKLAEDRRNWLLSERQKTGNFPKTLDGFYTNPESSGDLSNENLAIDRGFATNKGPKKSAKDTVNPEKAAASKQKGGPGKGKGKGKGKPVPDEAALPKQSLLFSHDSTNNILKQLEDFTAFKTEFLKDSKNISLSLAEKDVLPQVQAELSARIDEELCADQINLKVSLDGGKRKVKPSGKKASKTKPPKKWCAAARYYDGFEPDAFVDLVKEGVLANIEETDFDAFIGAHNQLEQLERLSDSCKEPFSGDVIKQMLTEHVCLSLGSLDFRKKSQITSRSILLFGPPSCGKTMLARAIATHVGATFINISPRVLRRLATEDPKPDNPDYFDAKSGTSHLIAKVLAVAQANAPSLIFMDNCENIFHSAKFKKAKTKDPDQKYGAKIKKDLVALINQIKTGSVSEDKDRIVVMGCAENVDSLDEKEIHRVFDSQIWVRFPDFETRTLLWRTFLHKYGLKSKHIANLEITVLANVSKGHTPEAIEHTCRTVLTTDRISSLETGHPITPHELLNPLIQIPSYEDTYESYKAFNIRLIEEGKSIQSEPES